MGSARVGDDLATKPANSQSMGSLRTSCLVPLATRIYPNQWSKKSPFYYYLGNSEDLGSSVPETEIKDQICIAYYKS